MTVLDTELARSPDRSGAGEVVQAGEVRSAPIESLRAIAALGVLVGHVSLSVHSLPNHFAFAGRLGVFLFFALTGYLLFWPFARRAFGSGRPISIGRYALNRALRVLPLYYVVLVTMLFVEHGGGSFEQWLRFATFTQSFFRDTVNTVNGPMWSLCVELQFYVLLPVLAWMLAWVSRRSALGAGALLLGLGSISFALWLAKVYKVQPLPERWAYSFPVTFFNFVPGMLLALIRLRLDYRRERWLPPSTLLIVAGLGCWLLYALDPGAGLDQPIAAAASFLLLAALVLPARPGVATRILNWRPLVAIGVVSYSLYLWHFPIVRSLGDHTDLGLRGLLPLALVVCLAVAFISYALVERPALRLRRRWGSTVAGSAAPEPRGGSALRS
jgi:peptidoglycan/LPS O-acetylase OafA/YrhL